ncbi:hypothetical protein AAEO56_06060 [Flavobacterium sp. DGU11]|uniref:Uncharacterized protein n=1 Tax=Flavobacterium arundinis TaxID=3139143 RepID=A0ABU9HVA5_9FLAO
MNKFMIIIALIILLRPVIPVAGYFVNYDYIVKELCENKGNTSLKCNGKCQLKKELAKASADTESTNPGRRIKVAEQEILYLHTIEEFVFPRDAAFIVDIQDSYTNFYSYKNSNSIFHPPLLY